MFEQGMKTSKKQFRQSSETVPNMFQKSTKINSIQCPKSQNEVSTKYQTLLIKFQNSFKKHSRMVRKVPEQFRKGSEQIPQKFHKTYNQTHKKTKNKTSSQILTLKYQIVESKGDVTT